MIDRTTAGGLDRATVLRACSGPARCRSWRRCCRSGPDEADDAGRTSRSRGVRANRALPAHAVLDQPRPAAVRGRLRPHPTRQSGCCARAECRHRATLAAALAESALLTARLAFFDLSRPRSPNDAMTWRSPPPARPATMRWPPPCSVTWRSSRPSATTRAGPATCSLRPSNTPGTASAPSSARGCTASPPKSKARAGAGTASRTRSTSPRRRSTRTTRRTGMAGLLRRWPTGLLRRIRRPRRGDQAEAAGHLTEALDALGPTGAKQRSVMLADLATRARRRRRPGRRLPEPGHGRAARRLVRHRLRPVRAVRPVLGDSRHGGQLDERIAALAISRAACREARPPASLCWRTSSGNSASESRRNRQRSLTAGRPGCSPTGRDESGRSPSRPPGPGGCRCRAGHRRRAPGRPGSPPPPPPGRRTPADGFSTPQPSEVPITSTAKSSARRIVSARAVWLPARPTRRPCSRSAARQVARPGTGSPRRSASG